MAAENDFLPFAVGPSANVLTQAQYAALTTLVQSGVVSGIAQSAAANKTWRQSSLIAAAVAQLVADVTGLPMVDNGQVGPLEAGILQAILGAGVILDTSVNVNVILGTSTPTVTSYIQGARFTVFPAQTNTGPVQANFGAGSIPVYGPSAVLAGGEMQADKPSVVIYSASQNAFILQASASGGGSGQISVNDPLYLYQHFGTF
jgi:hypothetical protein